MEGSAASSLLSGWGMLEVVFEFGGSKCPLMVTCESLQANLYEAAKAIRADFKKDLYIMQRYSIHNKLKKKGHVRESHTRDGLLSLGGPLHQPEGSCYVREDQRSWSLGVACHHRKSKTRSFVNYLIWGLKMQPSDTAVTVNWAKQKFSMITQMERRFLRLQAKRQFIWWKGKWQANTLYARTVYTYTVIHFTWVYI